MKIEKFIASVNQLLKKSGLEISISKDDIRVSESFITDAISGSKLSSNLSSEISPPIHSGEYYHYTSGA
jgi:hypothetical protein